LSSGGDFSASGKEDKSVIILGYLAMLFQPQMLNSIKQDGNTFINVEHIKIWKL
jgi:hypothetical protein